MDESRRTEGECPLGVPHNWVEFESSVVTGKFCARCDRVEWSSGEVRPGWRYSG